MKCKNRLALLLVALLVLSGCGNGAGSEENADDIFSDRDFEAEYDVSKSAVITLNGSSGQCDSDAVEISGGVITIKDEGTYILSGSLDDGMIVVDADEDDKTQVVLDGVSIHSNTSAPIYIKQADKVFVTLTEGSQNSLSNSGSFEAIDENEIDAVIFSKEDLTLNGVGVLTISSPAGHGIVSKDELAVTGGSYEITCASHGLSGKDGVGIAGGTFNVTSGKDGVHAENNDDSTLGYVYIKGGTFEITSIGDGISAESTLQIDGGVFDIKAGGGSENAPEHSSEWGDFGGFGGMGGPGNMGGFDGEMPRDMGGKKPEKPMEKSAEMPEGMPELPENMPEMPENTEDTTVSGKGLKATGLIVNGGTFKIDAADDGVHANGAVSVNGGVFVIATGDDGFHADETLTIAGGTIDISTSYEGLEGLHVVVSGGEISLAASDDGLNAAGGMDSSGFRGKSGNASNGSITISGGNLYVKASGDGIDANGTLSITGGNTVVCGPNRGDTATLDYDTSASITGGTFVGSGAMMMAQTFSDSTQGVLSVNVGNMMAGTELTVTDKSGNVLMTVTPELDFSVVIFSSDKMISGETYVLTAGSEKAEFTAQ